jgi:hypothetical protein
LDEKSITEQDAKQKKTRDENDARLKALLGNERYTEFEAAATRKRKSRPSRRIAITWSPQARP